MSKAVYYLFVTGSTTYVNVYADENAQSGGYISVTRKKDFSHWCITGGVGSASQDSLHRRAGVTKITRCRAKKILKDHGFDNVQMF